MSSSIIPTNREVKLDYNELIITKTDPSGKITYANKTFMKICDFPEDELLGQNHNIIRHPDMPKGVFYGLWQTIQQGREFFGVVKNLTKNGDYYWVLANIRPDKRNGQTVGYFSVRRSPSRRLIETVLPFYQQMLSMEKNSGSQAGASSWQWLEAQLAEKNLSYERYILSVIASTQEVA